MGAGKGRDGCGLHKLERSKQTEIQFPLRILVLGAAALLALTPKPGCAMTSTDAFWLDLPKSDLESENKNFSNIGLSAPCQAE